MPTGFLGTSIRRSAIEPRPVRRLGRSFPWPDRPQNIGTLVLAMTWIGVAMVLLPQFRATSELCCYLPVDHPRARYAKTPLERAPVLRFRSGAVDIEGFRVDIDGALSTRLLIDKLQEMQKVDQMMHPERPVALALIIDAERDTESGEIVSGIRAAVTVGFDRFGLAVDVDPRRAPQR